MRTSIKSWIAAIVLGLAAVGSSQAATVSSGVTKVGDGGGIDLRGSAVATQAYDFGVAPLAGADWVWGLGGLKATEVFEFAFDLTGFDVSTASLAGSIVVDNQAIIRLNGSIINSFLGDVGSHFRSVNAYGTDDSNLFNAGANLMTIEVKDFGGGYGLRANVGVTAAPSMAAVPLPASGLLLAGGLALLARRARRKS